MKQYDFYTDGAFSSKTKMGGWAFLCVCNDVIEFSDSGMEPFTTNNRMEIVAFLAVMEDIDKIAEKSTVNIYTDSAYLANTFNCGWYRNWLANGWKTSDKQPVKNQDLWGRIIALYIKNCAKHTIKIVKVAAHRDNKYNNMVDMLAVRERKRLEN